MNTQSLTDSALNGIKNAFEEQLRILRWILNNVEQTDEKQSVTSRTS